MRMPARSGRAAVAAAAHLVPVSAKTAWVLLSVRLEDGTLWPMPITLEFEGKEEGGNLNGSVKLGAFGSAPMTGVRA